MHPDYKKRIDKIYAKLTEEQLEQQMANMLNSEWRKHHQGKFERAVKELQRRQNEN